MTQYSPIRSKLLGFQSPEGKAEVRYDINGWMETQEKKMGRQIPKPRIKTFNARRGQTQKLSSLAQMREKRLRMMTSKRSSPVLSPIRITTVDKALPTTQSIPISIKKGKTERTKVATLSKSSQKGQFKIHLKAVEVSEFQDGQLNNLRDQIIRRSIEMTQHPIKIIGLVRNTQPFKGSLTRKRNNNPEGGQGWRSRKMLSANFVPR